MFMSLPDKTPILLRPIYKTIRTTADISQGNHYCSRDYGSSASNSNSYHYSNTDGSYYYSNSDGSTYHNDGHGNSTYKK